MRTLPIGIFIISVAFGLNIALADSHLEGWVINTNGVPQAYVEVRFEGPSRAEGRSGVIVFTDQAGKFTLPPMTAGNYSVTVDTGTRRASFNVKVNDKLSPPELVVRW
jgi:hypothetical protein